MKKYKILDHRADLKIKVFGKTKEELFKNAMLGMFESANYQIDDKTKTRKRKIKIVSFDFFSLLVDFLSELLFLSETKKEVYFDIDFKKFSEKKLEGFLIGQKIKKMGIHIKGVTYHDLKIIRTKNGSLEVTILFDI